ncbi:glycoside hydrolase family 2 TIM barrel-domain containing protein [Fundicoccus sp. Sow4_H7]|uniref:glycoside hydrolase family 2 TIM barrel-domain containing protein n=1 Tax=Fundicoccus sp. Sow4_H7 TaxID=3438784 RepID=UPI003F8EB5C6
MTPDISWLDNPEIFREGNIASRSDHKHYRSYQEFEEKKSSFVQSLNGDWSFVYSKNPKVRPLNFYETDFDAKEFDLISVPSHIEFSDHAQQHYVNTMYPWDGKQYRRPPYTLDYKEIKGVFSESDDNSVGSYIKEFDVEEVNPSKRYVLQFEGVEQAMFLWVNGQFVGYAEDSFTISEFDITDFIKEGTNKLAVEVYRYSTAAYLEDQDFFRFFGIYRSVNLLEEPIVHLNDLKIEPTLNDDFKVGTLKVTGSFSGDNFEGYQIRAKVLDSSNKQLFDETKSVEKNSIILDQVFNDVELWSNTSPKLYQLFIEVLDEKGELIELVPYQFGFRRIEIIDKVIYLNGERLIINGVNRHEWHPRKGRSIGLDEMIEDIDICRRNNINAVRTAHYPNQIEWYYLCDQAGIYLMAEMNLESHGTWQKMGQVEPSYNVPGSISQWEAVILDRAKTNYEVFKNHTSILFWSLGNESFVGDVLEKANAYYKNVDPSRLTHYEGVVFDENYKPTVSDVESRMYAYPEHIKAYLDNDPQKPFILCEFMHNMGNSIGGFGSYMELLDLYPSYQGGFIWDFIDQAIYVHDEVSGKKVLRYGGDFDDRPSDYEFSANGIVFATREEKPAMQEVKYYYGKY